jgi:NADH-quinone oxidoreductase subunit E
MSTIHVDPARVDAILERWRRDPAFAIEMLLDVQAAFRHLPRAALEQIARALDVDLGRLHHIATFYKAFSLEPRGELPIQVCTGTACHVRGAARVLDAFSRELGVQPGQTTPDLRFTLEGVRCVGCCSLAPVVVVGKDLHGELDSSRVARLLKRYRKADRAASETADSKEAADA